MTESKLTPNQLTFLALANEYCQALESAAEAEKDEFVDAMLRLLPRLYISATDLPEPVLIDEEAYIPQALDEDYYESVRRSVEGLLGEDDTYLEVFEDDMKYSDTPIGASVAEGLADLFQVFFNLTEQARESTIDTILLSLDVAKEDFASYWSQPLCNVLRALNAIKYQR